jgi:hypothetical protein
MAAVSFVAREIWSEIGGTPCENRERYTGTRYKSRSQPTISEREVLSSLKQNRFSTDPTVAK